VEEWQLNELCDCVNFMNIKKKKSLVEFIQVCHDCGISEIHICTEKYVTPVSYSGTSEVSNVHDVILTALYRDGRDMNDSTILRYKIGFASLIGGFYPIDGKGYVQSKKPIKRIPEELIRDRCYRARRIASRKGRMDARIHSRTSGNRILTKMLTIKNLKVYFSRLKRLYKAVDGVSLSLPQNKTLGLVGESGSGKTVTAYSIMGFELSLPGIIAGEIWFNGTNLLSKLPEVCGVEQGKEIAVRNKIRNWRRWRKELNAEMREIRGRQIAMLFQEPMMFLDPLFSVADQMLESIRLNGNRKSKAEEMEIAENWLTKVGIRSPKDVLKKYPHQLSGGMTQRVMLAMALACSPKLLIADEPTTALDATVRLRILRLLKEIQRDFDLTMLLISHDLNMISALSDQIAVMYAGRIVENCSKELILDREVQQRHPYTKALLNAMITGENIERRQKLAPLRGEVPKPYALPEGCKFYPRCDEKAPVEELCAECEPPDFEVQPNHTVRCWLYQ